MDIIKKIQKYFEGKDPKKLRENTIIIIIVGIIVIIAGSVFLKGKAGNEHNNSAQQAAVEASARTIIQREDIETRLETILSQIEGAGRVYVMITFYTGQENVPAYDTKDSKKESDEKDSAGGTRKSADSSSDTSIVFQESAGEKTPVIIKKIEPQAKGALIVSEGASDPEVRDRLLKAAQVLLELPAHKIQIIEKKK